MKKWIAVLMCTVLVLSLSGCGCGSKNKDSDKKDKTEATADSNDKTEEGESGSDKLDIFEKSENSDSSDSSNSSESSGSSEKFDNSTGESAGTDQADADNLTGTVEVESKEIPKNTEETIYINASDKTPVAAFEFTLTYDTAVLEVVEYGFADEFKEAYNGMYVCNDVGGETIFTGANISTAEQYYTGPVAYVKVKPVGESGTKGTVSLKAGTLSTVDGKDRAANFEAKDGVITIK